MTNKSFGVFYTKLYHDLQQIFEKIVVGFFQRKNKISLYIQLNFYRNIGIILTSFVNPYISSPNILSSYFDSTVLGSFFSLSGL